MEDSGYIYDVILHVNPKFHLALQQIVAVATGMMEYLTFQGIFSIASSALRYCRLKVCLRTFFNHRSVDRPFGNKSRG